MLKKLLVFQLLTVFCFIGCKKQVKNKVTCYIRENGDTLMLFGSVKSVKSVYYKAFDSLGTITKGQIISDAFNPSEETLQFNAAGKISTILQITGRLTLESTFKNGDLAELRAYENGNLIELQLYKRVKGIVTERKVYLDSTLFEFEKSTLNENGKVNKIQSFDKEGNIKWIQYCKYYYGDSLLLKEEWSNDKNNLVSQSEYDKYGNKIKSIEIFTDVHSQKKDTTYKSFEYLNKKLIKTTFKSGFSKGVKSTQYVYNNLGKLIKSVTFDKNAQPIESNISNYDTFGNLISYKVIRPLQDELEYTTSYEFDKNNNWIKSIEMKGIVPVQITERQITYN